MKRNIAILGSTGSIGTQAIDVIRRNKDLFQVEVLTANENVDMLIKQAREFVPNAAVIVNEDHYYRLKKGLDNLPVKVFCGKEALEQVVSMDSIQMVLIAMVGFSGLKPTIAAINADKAIALANKETLVVAGEIIMKLAEEKNVPVIPVDSEHSAIYQCLVGEFHDTVEKVILTASGGPFFGKQLTQLKMVTPADALKHPNWDMGPKVTIDSATMMNKGLEVIEAKWLFKLEPEQIKVIIHPQSIIHSLVQFRDGSIKAQMGLPDMRLPIQYALSFPERIPASYPRFSFMDYPNLTFSEPDIDIFRNLAISFKVMQEGGNWPCIMNAANEVAVEAFLSEKIGFLDIPDIIENVLVKTKKIMHPTVEVLYETDKEARELTGTLI